MNNEVSKIQIESGTYDIKDTTARNGVTQVSNDLTSTATTLQNNITANTNAINQTNIRIDNLENRKFIVVGDSYAEGYSPDATYTSWAYLLKDKLKLTNSNFILTTNGGCCFGNSENSYNILLTNLTSDNSVTDIIICGGYNDLSRNSTSILSGMSDVRTTINNKFPNAKVYVGFIGGTTNNLHSQLQLKNLYYVNGCKEYDFCYLPNLQYILFDETLFSSDGIHPNQNGQNKLASGIYQALNNGFNYINFTDIIIDTSQSDGKWQSSEWSLHLYQNNNTSCLSNYSGTKYFAKMQDVTINLNHNSSVKIGKITTRAGIIGTEYYSNSYFHLGHVIIQSGVDGYFSVPCDLFIDNNGYVYLKLVSLINDDHTNYQNYNSVATLQIPQFAINYITEML